MSTTPSANNPPPPGLPPVSDMKASDGVFTETLRVMGNLSLDKSEIPAVVPAVQNGSEANPFTDISTMVAATDIELNGSAGVIYVADGTLVANTLSGEVTVSNSSVSPSSVILFSVNAGAGTGLFSGSVTDVVNGSFDFKLVTPVSNGATAIEVNFVVV